MAKSLGNTFSTLSRSLKRLGFKKEVKKNGYIIFTHSSGRPLIMLPAYKPGEVVQPIHHLMVEKQLTDAGLIRETAYGGKFSARAKGPIDSFRKAKV